MSLSKDKKERLRRAQRRAKRNKILIILASVLVVAGIAAAVVMNWDKIVENWSTPPADGCGSGAGHDPRNPAC